MPKPALKALPAPLALPLRVALPLPFKPGKRSARAMAYWVRTCSAFRLVGIVFQGDFDQAVQAWIGEVVLPADGGGADAVVASVVAELLGGQIDFGLLVFGRQIARRQNGGGADGQQDGFECGFHGCPFSFRLPGFRQPEKV